MTINPITNEPFTPQDADRLLGLGDQFMEDWEHCIEKHDEDAADCTERRAEWDAIRPLLAQAPAMLAALEAQAMADADPEAARRKGYYDRARELRDSVLRELGSKLVQP